MYRRLFGFNRTGDPDAYLKLVNDPNIGVVHQDTLVIDNQGYTAVYYESRLESNDREKERLLVHQEIARIIAEKPEYTDLKNQRQRELYLLTTFGIPTYEARDVVELAKPEMKGVRDRC